MTLAKAVAPSDTTADKPSDAELLARFCESGDEACFRNLVERYSAMVSSVCSAVLRNSTDVEDAFQATFFVLARKAAKITRRENIGAWLHRVALRCALTLRRRAVNRATVELPEDDQFADQELIKISTRAMISALHEQLDRLPQKSRVAMIAVYLEGLDQKSAAEKLGVNQAALQKRLERGRATLRRRLGMLGFAGVALSSLSNKAMAAGGVAVSDSIFSSTVSIALQVRVIWAKGAAMISGHKASLSLAQGVFKSMMFTSAIQTAAAIVVSASIGLAAFSAATLAQDQQPTEQPNTQSATLLPDTPTSAETGPPNPGVEVAQTQPFSNPQPNVDANSQQQTASNVPVPTVNSGTPATANGFPFSPVNQQPPPFNQNTGQPPVAVPTTPGFPMPSSQQQLPSGVAINSQQPVNPSQIPSGVFAANQPANVGLVNATYPDRIFELEASRQSLKQRIDELEQQLALYKRLQQLENEIEELQAENAELRAQLESDKIINSRQQVERN